MLDSAEARLALLIAALLALICTIALVAISSAPRAGGPADPDALKKAKTQKKRE